MKHVQAITARRCRALSSKQVSMFNTVYRNLTLSIGNWHITFEFPPLNRDEIHREKVFAIELLVRQAHAEQTLILELLTDRSDVTWREYVDDVKILAWSLSHQGLLDCLQHILVGDLTVIGLHNLSPTNVASHQESVPLNFTITDDQRVVHWRGCLPYIEGLVDQDLFAEQGELSNRWARLPIPFRIFIDEFEIGADEANKIQPGGFIRLNHSPGSVFKELELDCAPLKIKASAHGSNITLLSNP